MRTPIVALVVVGTGCFQVPLASNDPDSGVICRNTTSPGGSASLQGASAFGVGAVYQSAAQTIPPDAGVTGASLHLQVLRGAPSCAQARDAGPGEGLFATVSHAGVDRINVGRYPTAGRADGGPYFYAFALLDGGLRAVVDGTLDLTSIAACSATGSFDVRLGIEDGGVSALTGGFTSEYCK